jgi:transposase
MDGDAKANYLREYRILNPVPDRVVDELFLAEPFFDPRDLVQVKYEMLRRVLIEGESATTAAAAFGFSRTAYYQILASFRHAGLPGLIPERPGPRGAHKLTEDIVEFLETRLAQDETLSVSALVTLLHQRFKLVVHPRSVERALTRRKKGR